MKTNPVTVGWERLAELYIKYNGVIANVTTQEQHEIHIILKNNAEYWTKIATLKNLSLMAHLTDDTAEQLKICAAIDELDETGTTDYFRQLGGKGR